MTIRIGINCISPAALPLVRTLLTQNGADYCELMVDNFIHLPPAQIRAALPDVPLALHIVSSRFLEKSADELALMAQHLRSWIVELQPLYVSDHLVQFSDNHRCLPMIRELDYARDQQAIRLRVQEWQALLGVPLLLENHASLTKAGVNQASFFAELLRDTGVGLLFDVSNAHIAECNHVCDFKQWNSLINTTSYFHVAGFRCDSKTGLALDTHDRPIDDAVLARLTTHLSSRDDVCVVIECDAAAADVNVWLNEIQRVRNALALTPSVRLLERDALHQRVFGRAPLTIAMLGNRCDAVLSEFVEWADKQRLTYGWSLSVHLLSWLSQQSEWSSRLSDEIKKELLQAAAHRWSLNGMDDMTAQGLLLRSSSWPGYAVGIWKAAINQAGRQLVLQLPESVSSTGNCYAISRQQGSWDGIEWVVVPA